MRTGGLRKVLEHLQRFDGGGLSDGQLLGRFLDGRDEAAFAALVRRHGPMVLGVCRRVLGNLHDAEDAFQATFLILARKAASVLKGEALAAWLCRVAYRTALEARARAVKRRAHERQVEDMPHPEVGPPQPQDWRPLLDRELDAMPQKYRMAIVLCDLEGRTRREAARHLGLAEGTFSSQLTRGRRLLARRLARCGVSLSGGALAGVLSEGAASAAVAASLVNSTVEAAVHIAAGSAAAVATPAALLMNEVLKAMLMTKLKVYVATAVVAVLLGVGGLVYRVAGQSPPVAKAPADRPLTELELLRREVEILKLQVEVMQAELRALKGQRTARMPAPATPGGQDTRPALPAMAPPTGKAPQTAPANRAPMTAPTPRFQPADTLPRQPGPAATADPALAPALPGQKPRDASSAACVSPEEEVEAALKAFQKARESRDTEATRQAAAALEKVLKKLRQQVPPANKLPASP
jgi:RNA polymerase sigma factor (sigma-70 family)